MRFGQTNTLLRPFKALVCFESNIRSGYAKLKESSESDPPADTTNGAPLGPSSTNDPLLTDRGDWSLLPKHMELLVNFMDNQMDDIWKLRKQIDAGTLREIAFEDLWHLYRPGQLVFTGTDGPRRAYYVLHVTGGRSILDVHGKAAATSESDRLGYAQFEIDMADSMFSSKKASRMTMAKSPLQVDCCYCDYDGE